MGGREGLCRPFSFTYVTILYIPTYRYTRKKGQLGAGLGLHALVIFSSHGMDLTRKNVLFWGMGWN